MKNIMNASIYSLITISLVIIGIYIWNSDPLWITVMLIGFAILFTICLYAQKILDEIKKNNQKKI
ncbi:hypothetical protein SAMN04487886_12703 [Clostridium sp. DSM 8431]|uniref:hypothetical protein n=1 Tax=Clostridium sp. DSM 8431 TaxID=1761781 RepID=UPI0008E06F99|nr:hypothetical protein [Clostridium sp. DSM 8431]SFU88656.1 hypothetical protein SAMN04487886_12703 [Clostridium sp. DSM 8431]